MTEDEYWRTDPNVFNACVRRWCKKVGIKTDEDIERDREKEIEDELVALKRYEESLKNGTVPRSP